MKNEHREQARNLYFETNLTQAQIADLVGIAHKTMSAWVAEGQWKLLKENAKEMPSALVESMLAEVVEINEAIRSRPPGLRAATHEEAEVRRKILASVNYIQARATAGTHIEVLMNFMQYAQPRITLENLQFINKLADDYLKNETPLWGASQSKLYTFHIPPPLPETENPNTENPEYNQRWSRVVTKFHKQNGTKPVVINHSNDQNPAK